MGARVLLGSVLERGLSRLNLRAKILLPLLFFVLLIFGYLYGIWIPKSFVVMETEQKRSTERHLESVAEALIPLLIDHQLDTVFENLAALKQNNKDWTSIELISSDNKTLYPLNPSQPAATESKGSSIIMIEKKINYMDLQLGKLVVQINIAPRIAEMKKRFNELMITLFAAVILFLIAVILVLEEVVRKPVKLLAVASKKLAFGEYDTPLPKTSNDEVGTLLNSFIDMRNSIKAKITERRQAEEALRENKEYLENLINYANAPIIVWDPQFRITRFNHAFESLTGRTADKVIGESLEILFPSDLVESSMKLIKKTVGGERWEVVEINILHRDGSVRTVLWNSATLFTPDGKTLVATIAQGQDITERKQAEERLLVLNQAIEALPIGMTISDLKGKILYTNPSDAEAHGYTVDELIGKDARMFAPEETWKPISFEQLSSLGVWKRETINIKKSGEVIPVYLLSIPVRNSNGKPIGIVTVCEDITERKKLEAQLLQAQKMESIGTLAGGVAHDFNNILSAIIGYGHVTLMKMAKDDPLRLNIERMNEAADRAAHLTQSLLAFGRKQVMERKSVDLNEIIRRVEKFLIRIIGEDIECKTVLYGRPIPVFADKHQFEQVLMNLATNARDAMPKGGTFTVTTEQVMLDNEFITVHGYGGTGAYAMITISDTGTGIDEEMRQRIFEPFFTTKEVGKGTGLGLSVVYGIIKQHEGYIDVYSEPGKGTTFRIYLPVIASEVGEEKKSDAEGLPARGTETILLAEDDESMRKLLKTVLTEFGYMVIEAVDGEDAVKKFIENKNRINLLLFDIIMPKMNGKEACDEIQKIQPDVKAIFASGYAPDALRDKVSLDAGANIVFKPVSPEALLRKIREMLDSR